MFRYVVVVLFLLFSLFSFAQSGTCTLTVVVEGMSSSTGNLGILVFNSDKGWPDDRTVAFRDIAIPAEPGSQKVKIPDLPAGRYAISLVHDENKNHKVDKNWIGQPKEQWGMSNSLHATLKAPPIEKAWFDLPSDKEIHIKINNP
jgi:uncharacterized protein (DUF2141 family)